MNENERNECEAEVVDLFAAGTEEADPAWEHPKSTESPDAEAAQVAWESAEEMEQKKEHDPDEEIELEEIELEEIVLEEPFSEETFSEEEESAEVELPEGEEEPDKEEMEELLAPPEDVVEEIEEDDEETVSEQYEQEMASKFESMTELLDEKRYVDFRIELQELNPVDAADFFSELPLSRIPAVFKLLPKDIAADVFTELDADVQERIISAMTDREISTIIEEMSLDDAADIVEELPANIVYRIMKNAAPETRADINRLLAYPEGSAGSVMNAEFINLHKNMTCAQAVAHIRRTGEDKETFYVAYVTDSRRVLEGIVPLRALLFSSADDLIEDIMDPNVISASTLDDQETVAQLISKYDMLALPIVDKEKRLVGIVTVDDAMDVMEAEATEDIEIMAAISPTDKPYLKTSVWETWKKRVPWLLLLMISATFTSVIMARFESVLDMATVSLSVFVPMLMGTGGNASSQTSTTVIRGLSLGEIEMRDILRVLWKEIRVAAFCGGTVAAVCFAKTMLVDMGLVFTWTNVQVALIVCATMFCTVMLAKVMGVLLPIGAKRIGLDPAVMASPFITTIVDTVTLLIFVAIASVVLGL